MVYQCIETFAKSCAPDIPRYLARFMECVENQSQSLQPFTSQYVDQLFDLFETGRFHITKLGKRNRGKSTLLNTSLSDVALSTAAIPLATISVFKLASPAEELLHLADVVVCDIWTP